MKKRDFYFFVVPSLLMMFLFIAVPLAIVFKQSFYITQNVFEKVEVETPLPHPTSKTVIIFLLLNPLII